MRRGEFITGMGAALMMPGCRVSGWFGGAPAMRFGVVSDVHLNLPGDEDHFLKALRWFRDRGADAVMIAGDIADTGEIQQFERMARCWFEVFPGDRAPDGRRVERLFVYGNHDIEGWTWKNRRGGESFRDDADRRARALGYSDNRGRVWERLFQEEYSDFWLKEVKGFTFIGGQWNGHCPGIEAFMKRNAAKIDPSRPFFYTQHSHPRDTCFGDWCWGHDPGYATRAMSAFANAVVFSGHSHYPLSDERTVWQGAFTSINTATLRRTSLDYAGYENSRGNSFDRSVDPKTVRLMQPMFREDGKQGMLVDVYSDGLVLHRHDFTFDSPMGPDWELSIPSAAGGVFDYGVRRVARTAPEFAPDAVAKAEFLKTAPECASAALAGRPCVRVSFPEAVMRNGCRPFDFEVSAVAKDGRTVARRKVLANGFHLPFEESHRPNECLFTADELAGRGDLVFSIVPRECFGVSGGALTARFSGI